ncbi:MAG: hypothetical protein NT069_30030 [Planctomycetota bacterium]|nr:hypothetical protein [Planctomycetota bacterium]
MGDELTWDEIQAVADEQLSRLRRVTVRWKSDEQIAEGERAFHISSRNHAQATIASRQIPIGMSEDQIAQIAASAASRADPDQHPTHHATFQELWSDGENFQFRFLVEAKTRTTERYDAETPGTKFPDAPPNPDTLVRDYRDVAVLSFGPATRSKFRMWSAQHDERSGYHDGLITTQNPLKRLRTPPLFSVSQAGIDMHPLTGLFSPGAKSSRVIGRSAIAGVDCLMVERLFDSDRAPLHSGFGELYRAWLDPQRGYMPVRVEIHYAQPEESAWQKWYARVSQGMAELNPPSMDAPTVFVVVSSIQEVIPGAYYPMKGTEFVTGPAPIEGGRLPQASAIHQKTVWEVERVVADPPMDTVMFALQFPSSTLYFDESQQQIFVTTDADGHVERIVNGSLPSTSPSGFRYWTQLVLTGVGTCIGFGLFYYRRRHSGVLSR